MVERPAVAEACARSFQDRFGGAPAVVAWAPGRVNLVGEHTDYNDGLAMPAAIDRWVAVALRRAGHRRVWSETWQSEWGGGPPSSSWERAVAGALAVFPEHVDVEAVVLGDVPPGAGLSSSAALLVAWMNGLCALAGVALPDLDRCRLAQRVEHEHLGVHCGLLDQVASQCSRAGHVLVVDFADLSLRHVPADPGGLRWLVLDSGVRRELSGGAYQDRVRECREGLAAVRARVPAVAGFRDLRIEHLGGHTPGERRLRHVVSENARVEAAARHVEDGRWDALGALLDASHRSLRDDFAVSCAELDRLADLATASPGCLGARMVGGGFGGCVLALVEAERAATVERSALDGYRRSFDHPARAFRFRMVGGAAVG